MQLPFLGDEPTEELKSYSLLLLVALEHLRRAGAFERCTLIASDAPALTGPLAKGSRGPAVKRWQEYLLAGGQDLGPKGADTFFGPVTEAATERATGSKTVTPEMFAQAFAAEERFEFEGLNGSQEELAHGAARALGLL